MSFEDNLALIKVILSVSSASTPLNSTLQHVIAIFNPLIRDSGRLILKTSQMGLRDAFSDASAVSPASRSHSVVRSFREPSIAGITPTRSIASPVSILQRQIPTPPPTQSPAVASDASVRMQLSDNIHRLTWTRGSSLGEPLRGLFMAPCRVSAPHP